VARTFDDDAALRKEPPEPPAEVERLSPIGHVCHLRDIEIDGYHVRIARMRAENAPFLVSLDSERLAQERGYDAAALEPALHAFEEARRATLATLAGVASEEWARRGTFEGYGDVTLLRLVEILAGHDAVHIAALDAMPRRLDV
jgi:hypothetical protein